MKSEAIFFFHKRHCSARGTHDYNLGGRKRITIITWVYWGGSLSLSLSTYDWWSSGDKPEAGTPRKEFTFGQTFFFFFTRLNRGQVRAGIGYQ